VSIRLVSLVAKSVRDCSQKEKKKTNEYEEATDLQDLNLNKKKNMFFFLIR
jgi:hypothetical protein